MDELRFDGRVAVVTGAGGGLGREYARLLAARGAAVVVNDLGGDTHGAPGTVAVAEAAAAEIRGAGGAAVADGHSVGTPGGARAIVEAALEAYGRIDIIVNNAGISAGGAFDAIPPDVFELVLRVHLLGHVFVTQAAWPHFRAQDYGRVVNVTSGSVWGMGNTAPYASAKAAIIGLTHSEAAEARGSGISANAIMPIAYTRMTEQIPDAGFRGWLEAKTPASKVAPGVAFLAHEQCPVSGEVFTVGGGHMARVFLTEARGYTDHALTLEHVRDHFDEIRDPTGSLAFGDAMEEVAYYMGVLGRE